MNNTVLLSVAFFFVLKTLHLYAGNPALEKKQYEEIARDLKFQEKYSHIQKELEQLRGNKERPIVPFSFGENQDACECETPSPLKSPLESHNNPKQKDPASHSTLADSCKECHENKNTGFSFENWMDEEEEWERRLSSSDETEKAKAKSLLFRLYNGLVDTKNMPPLNETERRNEFYNNPGNKKFIEFLKSKKEALEGTSAGAESPTIAPNRISVMDSKTEQNYRNLFPKVDSPRLEKVLNDPNLIMLDKKHMVPGYQDPSLPVAGERTTEPGFKGAGFGNNAPFIDKNGHLKLWSTGFGIENSTKIKTFHFIQLPRNTDGSLQKIKVSKQGPDNPANEMPLYRWEFPTGTVSGEAIMATDSNGKDHILEIRLRTKDQSQGPWAADIFRPFPTRESLKTKLQAIVNSNSILASEAEKALRELNQTSRLRPISLGMHGYQLGDLDSKGATETLPNFSEGLTKELLKEPFKSSLGTEWDRDKALTAFGATTEQPFSIVPENNNGGAVQVGRINCAKCHKEANKPIHTFYNRNHPQYLSSIVAYGNTPGDDQNLRFNIFDQTEFKNFGLYTGPGSQANTDNRKINPNLLPILDVK